MHFIAREETSVLPSASLKLRLHTASTYIGAFLSAIMGAIWVHQLSPGDLASPWRVLDSDLSSAYSLAQATGQSWFGIVNHSLGAPFTADFSMAFIPDDLQIEILRIIMHITRNPFVAVNFFYLLTFGLCAVSFLFLTDQFKLTRWLAFPLALSYAWLPYHFTRMDAGHVFLAAYYMIPIGIIYLHRLFTSLTSESFSFYPQNRWRKSVYLLGIIAVGSSGTYYGVFFALLCASLILLAPRRNLSLNAIFKRCMMVTSTSFLFISAPLVRIISAQLRGLETVLTRSPEESVQFGGSIARLLVPWGVWLPQKMQPMVSPTEFEWNATSLLGAIGVWLLIFGIASTIAGRTRTNEEQQSSRYIFLWAVLFYSTSGISLVFAYGVDSSFRCWNRLSIVIMTLALLTFGLCLRRIRLTARIIGPLMTILVLFTQLTPLKSAGIGAEPDQISKEAFTSLQTVAKEIQHRFKPGCMILQLPIMAFPEGGQVGRVGNGFHFWLPLLTHSFHWSYGAPKGSLNGDFWENEGTTEFNIRKAKTLGFCAAVFDTRTDLLPQITEPSKSFLLGDYQIFLF